MALQVFSDIRGKTGEHFGSVYPVAFSADFCRLQDNAFDDQFALPHALDADRSRAPQVSNAGS
jgi:hypothetical protein